MDCKKVRAHCRDSSRHDGLNNVCKCCASQYHKQHKARQRAYQKTYRERIKREVIGELGGHCVNCFETDTVVLSVDHIDQKGGEHRKKIGNRGGYHFYEWLKRNNYPNRENYRVLCLNCQHRAFRGLLFFK